MTNRYFDLIDQTFYFPQEGFDIEAGNLVFNGVPLMYLVKKYGTPIKITYLPKIGAQIKRAKNLFTRSMKSMGYGGRYYYCYCTKTCHFSYVLNEVLKHDVQLETSSSFDIDIIRHLHKLGKISKDTIIVNNGFKPPEYAQKISSLINDGFKNVIPVMDNKEEIELFEQYVKKKTCNIGIRVATEEELKKIDKEAQKEAEESAEFAKSSPYPEPETIFEDVYWEVDNKTEAGQTGRHFFND